MVLIDSLGLPYSAVKSRGKKVHCLRDLHRPSLPFLFAVIVDTKPTNRMRRT